MNDEYSEKPKQKKVPEKDMAAWKGSRNRSLE